MYDLIIKHTSIFLYIISLVSASVSIALVVFLHWEHRSNKLKQFAKFLCAFLFYDLMNFVVFYKEVFLNSLQLNPYLMSLFDLSFVCFIFFWLKLLSSMNSELDGQIEGKPDGVLTVVKVCAVIYVLIWFAAYNISMDINYHVNNQMWQNILLASDTVIISLFIIFSGRYILNLKEENGRLSKSYFVSLWILMSLYLVWFIYIDYQILYYNFSPKIWINGVFDPILVVNPAISIMTIMCIAKRGAPFSFLSEEGIIKHQESLERDSSLVSDKTQNDDRMDLESFAAYHSLTQREKEIVEMICRGKSTPEIAEEKFISPFTVKRHITNIYKKINVKNRMELIFLIKIRP